MHAVVVNVTITDRNAAESALRENIVPSVSALPGFVAGYWVAISGDKGASMEVFDSEQAARDFAGQLQPPPGGPVTFDSIEVGEVVAHA